MSNIRAICTWPMTEYDYGSLVCTLATLWQDLCHGQNYVDMAKVAFARSRRKCG